MDFKELKIIIEELARIAEFHTSFQGVDAPSAIAGYKSACEDILKQIDRNKDNNKKEETNLKTVKIEYKEIKFFIDQLYKYYLRDIKFYEQDFIGFKKERDIIYEKSELLNQLDDLLKKGNAQIVHEGELA